MASLIISSLLILVLLSVSANTDESDPDCIPSLMVPRNTMWRVRVSDHLKINCTVVSESHCWKNVDVSWCRIDNKSECRYLKHSDHILTGWRSITESKRMSFLIFWKISMQDAGLYRCEIKSPTPTVSHAINVIVTESDPDCTPSITVPRNRVWRARVTDFLMINCTVVSESHCWKNMEVSWCRIDDKNGCRPLKHSSNIHIVTELRSISDSKRTSFVIFWKISMQDAGLYRCEITSPEHTVNHTINVTVTGTPAVTVNVTDETHTPLSGEKWFYVIYFSVFVFALILAVPLVLSRGLKKFLKDEVTMTTVTYEEAEKSSVQD
ncbi:uncharacterized protein LOC128616861 [Ictalurus furcatus]|uniref:uncharacterized protein LOC128616861 n=1 Tax=Ictalurus furcatus TaxID=66913 RepID=UPI00235049A9|nr:uncharacterized protein LOC128616861 [Ictalurus furcatus]